MRTPLVWRLRVTISPWSSWPDFLKEPMLAMSLLLAVFELRDHRGLDGDLKAEGGRRRTHPGPKRSGGRRRRDFLGSRGMGEAQGKKVSPAALAVQAIQGQPRFGAVQ